jgi:hypothetical protein
MSIRTFLIIFSSLALTVLGCAAAEKTPPKDKKDPPAKRLPELKNVDPAVVRLLDRLEDAHRDIKSLEANVIFTKTKKLLRQTTEREGTVQYMAGTEKGDDGKPGKPQRFRIVFDTLIVNDVLRKVRLDFVFDGQWLVEKDHDRKFCHRRQVVAPGKRLNPLALDGPFPIPLNQKRQVILERFNVKLIDPTEKEIASAKKKKVKPPFHLSLTPKEKGGNQPLKTVDLWFAQESLLPVRVDTVSPRGDGSSVKLSKVTVNQIDEAKAKTLFDTSAPPKGAGWRVEIEPLKGG